MFFSNKMEVPTGSEKKVKKIFEDETKKKPS